jgi:exodeoxyribonuclease III
MALLKLISWNVNGIRAIYKKGLLDWLGKESPDILCLQETKANEGTFPEELKKIEGYQVSFSEAERKGYSGVATFSKIKPQSTVKGFGIEVFDNEGRISISDFGSFSLFNIYFPNGKASGERLKYKMDFYDAFLDTADRMKAGGKSIIVCGDVNTAHKEIDIARPKENSKVSGFLPEERAWIDKLVSHGYVDTFRLFNQEPGQYTWWDMVTRARERNVGWRIDYFYASADLEERVKSAFIQSSVTGSDHCPIGITVEI